MDAYLRCSIIQDAELDCLEKWMVVIASLNLTLPSTSKVCFDLLPQPNSLFLCKSKNKSYK